MESYLTDPRHDETQSPEERDASDDTRIAVQTGTIESEDGEIVLPTYKDVTPEEFFAEGTSPLADTSVKIDGDRTQLTETQMGAVVGEVLDQTVSENFDPTAIIPGETGPIRYGNPSTMDQMIVDSKLSAVYFRIETLEEQNKKIIAALKHLGLDTNKHFR